MSNLTIPGYDALEIELVQHVAYNHYELDSGSRARRIVHATYETCETFSYDDSSDLYGAIYVYVRNWLEQVITQE